MRNGKLGDVSLQQESTSTMTQKYARKLFAVYAEMENLEEQSGGILKDGDAYLHNRKPVVIFKISVTTGAADLLSRNQQSLISLMMDSSRRFGGMLLYLPTKYFSTFYSMRMYDDKVRKDMSVAL